MGNFKPIFLCFEWLKHWDKWEKWNFFICRKENTPLDTISNFQKYAAIRELKVLLALHTARLHS